MEEYIESAEAGEARNLIRGGDSLGLLGVARTKVEVKVAIEREEYTEDIAC